MGQSRNQYPKCGNGNNRKKRGSLSNNYLLKMNKHTTEYSIQVTLTELWKVSCAHQV